MLKELHEKMPGVRNPCSFRAAYGGGFAFEVNGEQSEYDCVVLALLIPLRIFIYHLFIYSLL